MSSVETKTLARLTEEEKKKIIQQEKPKTLEEEQKELLKKAIKQVKDSGYYMQRALVKK
jgi:DNA-binding IclR family transcriptional regulator